MRSSSLTCQIGVCGFFRIFSIQTHAGLDAGGGGGGGGMRNGVSYCL